jgi:sterol 3beta-glucosyltransferase
LIAMPFVPQPLRFAHGLVDLMLMHGGANTFYETVVGEIPLIVCPGFGDQPLVAQAASHLGIGVTVASVAHPDLAGARSVEEVAALLPEMLAPANRWKRAATELAARVRAEDGLARAEEFVLGPREA